MPSIKNLKLNWKNIQKELLKQGFTNTEPILSHEICENLIAGYDDDLYRSTINMKQYNFGSGEYKYYAYPLPGLISSLRQYFYKNLLETAHVWSKRLKRNDYYPDRYEHYIKNCHENGQSRPTPLILKYARGDFNTLHQDLYGDIHFPYQVAIMLNDTSDYSGGEFTLVEQRPRLQSIAHVQSLKQGKAIIFAVNEFPKEGKKGYYRARLRHGVSKIRHGHRHTLGIILHDAK